MTSHCTTGCELEKRFLHRNTFLKKIIRNHGSVQGRRDTVLCASQKTK